MNLLDRARDAFGSVRSVNGMTFFVALLLLIAGKKLRRKAWVQGVYITFDHSQRFVTLQGRGAPKRWTPYREDFSEEDWELVA